MDIKNFIDLHVHIGPEIIPRKFVVKELIKAEKGKMAGMALKSHFYPTIPLIICEKEAEDFVLIGSVTLNNYIGGLNADAIYASAKLSSRPIIVWFPTISAENFLSKSKYEIPPEWVGEGFTSRLSSEIKGIKIVNQNLELTEETRNVLKTIKENGCILATGHVSWQEAKVLVEEAVKLGISKVIITHPIYQRIAMPIQIQQQLSKLKGVYIEANYAMHLIDKLPIKEIAEQIKSIGSKRCIISSDLGQLKSPNPSDGIQKFTELLLKEGLSEKDIRIMGEVNPRELISIPKIYKENN